MQIQQDSRFPKFQNIYYKITWFIVILSVLLFVTGYLLVQAVVAAPSPLVQIALALLYYHFFHFVYGIFSLLYYLVKVKNKIQNAKVYKTILGILFTPASAFVCYMAVFLLAVASCSSN